MANAKYRKASGFVKGCTIIAESIYRLAGTIEKLVVPVPNIRTETKLAMPVSDISTETESTLKTGMESISKPDVPAGYVVVDADGTAVPEYLAAFLAVVHLNKPINIADDDEYEKERRKRFFEVAEKAVEIYDKIYEAVEQAIAKRKERIEIYDYMFIFTYEEYVTIKRMDFGTAYFVQKSTNTETLAKSVACAVAEQMLYGTKHLCDLIGVNEWGL